MNYSMKENRNEMLDMLGGLVETKGEDVLKNDLTNLKVDQKVNGANESYAKIFLNVEELKNILDFETLGFLSVLCRYVEWDGTMLRNTDNHQTPLTKEDIQRLAGWNKQKIGGVVALLMDNNVLKMAKDKENRRKNNYHFNPKYIYKVFPDNRNLCEKYDELVSE